MFSGEGIEGWNLEGIKRIFWGKSYKLWVFASIWDFIFKRAEVTIELNMILMWKSEGNLKVGI